MKNIWHILVLTFASLYLAGCLAETPYTHRKQLIMFSPQQELQMGYQAARQILQHEPISHDPRLNDVVRRVGTRIAQAANVPGYQWQFFVIDKDVVNAFCLPGGKVFVYKGLFKVIQNEDQLAAVMGHEVAHAIARHGAERMSMMQLGRLGTAVAAKTISGGKYAGTIKQAYGQFEGVGLVLPFSRKFEYEADEIGLDLMTKAGYDPHQAIGLWQNMMKVSQGKRKPPELLSTHPSDIHRINRIKKMIPKVLATYGRS